MANITSANWNYDTAAHLLLRAGFGHNGKLIRATGDAYQARVFANLGPDKTVDYLLTMRPWPAQGPGTLNTDNDYDFNRLTYWWISVMRGTTTPVREKMTLFLHGHFATARSKIDKTLYLAKQNKLFRTFAIGDFRELVKQVTIDPAMLWWLDGQLNKVGRPNENYARELQELFTLGVFDFNGNHNYSQNDVVQAARILTGWRVNEVGGRYYSINPVFTPSRHDSGSKTMFAPVAGETPLQNPANQFTAPANYNPATDEYKMLVDKIFDHVDTEGRPTAARFITRKLWKFFAYDPEVDYGTPRSDLTMIDELADEFKNSGYSLKALLRAMFLREEFYADRTRTVKGPTEYLVGSLRMLYAKFAGNELIYVGDRLKAMGQTLFDPPNVKGWDGNQAWITSQGLLKRFEFARDVASGDTSRYSLIGWYPLYFLDTKATTRQAVVDRFLKLLGPLQVDVATNTQLLAWLGATDQDMHLTDPDYVNINIRGLVNLILTLPQYHVH